MPLNQTTKKHECQLPLPSLAYQVPVSANLGVIVWQRDCTSLAPPLCTDDLVVQAPSVTASANSSAGSGVQTGPGRL